MEAKKTVILSVEVETTQRVRDVAKELRDHLRELPLTDTKVLQVQYNMAKQQKPASKAKRARR